MKYIYHHLGLGDHIICNGLVRKLIKQNENFGLFVKPHNRISVEFMFRDLKNLTLINGDDNFVKNYLNINKINNDDLLICGFGVMPKCSWDQVFYAQHNIDFKERWDSFKIERDIDREQSLYDFLNPNDDDYVLIHNVGSDGVDRLNNNIINPNLKKIYVEKHTENIFDYLMLLEKSKEVHCVESSFHVLVDSLNLNTSLFFHTLTNGRGFEHKIKDKWNIV